MDRKVLVFVVVFVVVFYGCGEFGVLEGVIVGFCFEDNSGSEGGIVLFDLVRTGEVLLGRD